MEDTGDREPWRDTCQAELALVALNRL